MHNAKNSQLEKSATFEMSAKNGDVRVVVVMDGITRTSIATIKKDMSSAVKRDLSILKRFGLTSG